MKLVFRMLAMVFCWVVAAEVFAVFPEYSDEYRHAALTQRSICADHYCSVQKEVFLKAQQVNVGNLENWRQARDELAHCIKACIACSNSMGHLYHLDNNVIDKLMNYCMIKKIDSSAMEE